MKAKRAKQYRKLMQQYGLTFGLREPYQVIVDAGMIQDADRFKMDLVKALERTLGGKIKPMITQCSIRHLYDAEPKNEAHIMTAKSLERRRCGHHTLETPLSTLACLTSVVDPKSAGINKYNYVIASQGDEVRAHMRSLAGVPLIYVKRSIMILEPMAGKSADVRTREERGKFRAGVARAVGRGGGLLGKRARDDERDGEEGGKREHGEVGEEPERKRKKKGPKEPNPLSMRKKKVREPREAQEQDQAAAPVKARATSPHQQKEKPEVKSITTNGADGEAVKKKRKRKHKPSSGIDDAVRAAAAGEMSDG